MATYNAFISYSHARDKAIASALQSVLQRLGKASYERRSLRVFRDDTSLSATPHLWPTIEVTLRHSDFFILLASPTNAFWHRRFVAAQLNLGDIHFRNGGDPDSAAAFYREGLAAARELAALDPSDPQWQKDLILALWRNAQLKQWQSDSLKARELSLEALAIAEHLERNSGLRYCERNSLFLRRTDDESAYR